MPDITQLTSDLRGLPDQALQRELQQPSGLVPSYLVLAEAQRRQLTRQAAQQQQQQQQQGQSSTVLQDVVRGMMAQQPPPGAAPAGMTPPRQGQSPMPGAQSPGQMLTPAPPQGMARGGRYADGGETDDDSDGMVDMPTTFNLNDAVNDTAKRHGLNPADLWGIVQTESRGNPNAVGPATRYGQAVGLMQLMPQTAEQYGVTDRRDPWQSLEGGAHYLADLHRKYNDWDLTRAAYNAGPGNVDKYGGVPPFRETQDYIRRSNRFASQFAGAEVPTDATPPVPMDQSAPPAQPDAARLAPDAAQADQSAAPAQAQPAQGGADDQPTTFTAEARPGRVHQNISDLQDVIDGLKKRITELPDPYSPDSMGTTRRNILSYYGLPPNYLQSLDAITNTRKATIRQLQDEAMQRYHNPSPWEFLANLSAGMGASGSLNLAGAFGQGVGLAWQRRDQQQQQAFSDWNSLQQDADQIDRSADSARGRFDTVLNSILTHQGTVNEAQRKLLTDQLTKATTEQEKWKKMLVPTNKLEAFYNPADFDQDQRDLAAKAMTQLHPGWNANRMQLERAAVQALAQRGNPFQQGGQYGTAYDQFLAQYPKEAQLLDAKAPKYAPEQVANWVKLVGNDHPEAYFDAHVIPKDALPAVQSALQAAGFRVPVRAPDKNLQQQAAASSTALMHADRVAQFAQDPWMVQHVFGPAWGRIMRGEEAVGMDIPGATQQQTRDAQDLLTSLNYLFMREGKALFGGRPPQMMMKKLEETSPGVNMSASRFLGALDAVRSSANIAIKSNHAYMYGDSDTRPIVSVPGKGASGFATDPRTGQRRQVMTPGPGQPWYYMDDGSEYKPPSKNP